MRVSLNRQQSKPDLDVYMENFSGETIKLSKKAEIDFSAVLDKDEDTHKCLLKINSVEGSPEINNTLELTHSQAEELADKIRKNLEAYEQYKELPEQ